MRGSVAKAAWAIGSTRSAPRKSSPSRRPSSRTPPPASSACRKPWESPSPPIFPWTPPTRSPTSARPAPSHEALAGVPTRLDVKAAQERDDTSRAQTHADWADYLPILTLLGEPIFQNPPTFTQPLAGWQAQLVLTLPLYDGSLRNAQARERNAIAGQATAQLELTLRQAKSEVRSAFDVLRHTDDALKAARDAAVSAQQALELANIAYAGGIGTNLDVIDAERRFRDAETSVAVAEDASRQARLDLLAAAGRFP